MKNGISVKRYKLLESPTILLRGPCVPRGFSRWGRICQSIEVEFWRVGRRLGLTLRAQPPIPPPTIARPSESSATLEDVEFMMLSIAAQVSVCGSMVVQP